MFLSQSCPQFSLFFFFNDPATTEIYTLSLHDALPILSGTSAAAPFVSGALTGILSQNPGQRAGHRSEEHTSELQSRQYLVCRLLLEKKKKKKNTVHQNIPNVKLVPGYKHFALL